MVDSQFWKERQAEFESYAQPNQYPELKAIWKAKSGRWKLWYGHTPDGIDGSKPGKNHVDTEGCDLFKILAGKAAAELAGSTRDAEGWELWLDSMRRRGCGFHGRGPMIEWRAVMKDGKLLTEVRRELDEWEILPATSSDSYLKVLAGCHQFEDGSIENVFAYSARCCEKLAAHGEITIEAPAPAAAEVAEPERDIESRKAERRKLCDDYKAECRRPGVKVTDEMIARAASPDWHTRAQVQKWLACHPEYDGEPDRLIRKVFREKPHLKPNG